MATSLISLDFDRDGDLDLIQTVKSEYHNFGFRLLENKLLNEGLQNYIVVKPRMNGTNHWAIGSMVKITTAIGTQIRPITAGISYFGQEPAEAFFGLGSITEVEEIEVTWPGGSKTTINDIAVNQVVTITDADALHPPINLSVEVINETTFSLSWQSSATISHTYQLERSKESNFATFLVVENELSTTFYEDSGLSPDSTYYYRVRATQGAEISRSSLHVRAQFREDINAPDQLVAEGVSQVEARVNWTDRSDNESGFRVQRSAQQDFSSFVAFDLPMNSESFLNDGLEPGATYYYRIQAYSDYGTSEFSEVVSVDLSSVLSVDDTNSQIIMYPNPSDGLIQFNSSEEVKRLTIFDLDGKLVSQYGGANIKTISTNLAEGIYQIRIETASGSIILKTVVIDRK